LLQLTLSTDAELIQMTNRIGDASPINKIQILNRTRAPPVLNNGQEDTAFLPHHCNKHFLSRVKI
jgi:hypothetical protein